MLSILVLDINECATSSSCNSVTSVCVNTAGDYYCDCKNETTANYKRGSTNKLCIGRYLNDYCIFLLYLSIYLSASIPNRCVHGALKNSLRV